MVTTPMPHGAESVPWWVTDPSPRQVAGAAVSTPEALAGAEAGSGAGAAPPVTPEPVSPVAQPAAAPLPAPALRAAFAGHPGEPWLASVLDALPGEPALVGVLFAAAARRCGRGALPAVPGWCADEAARVLLLDALGLPEAGAVSLVREVYRFGDAAEKRAVLRALPLLPRFDAAVELLHDAVRTNDARLLAAAVGPAARALGQDMWRQAVLKCVFVGVPLLLVADLDHRADAVLERMLAGFVRERRAARRPVPQDAAALLRHLEDKSRPEEKN